MKYRKTGMTTRAIDYRGIIYSMNETCIFHNKLVSNKMNQQTINEAIRKEEQTNIYLSEVVQSL